MANDPQPQNQQAQGFDVNGARQAGYSDDEILQHLTQSRNFDVQGAVNAGYQKSEIIDHLSQTQPQQQGTPIADKSTMQAQPSGVLPWLKSFEGDVRYGSQNTAPGKLLHFLGAQGVNQGSQAQAGDFMASPILGTTRAAQGVAELPSRPWQGIKDIGLGALDAAQIPFSIGSPAAAEDAFARAASGAERATPAVGGLTDWLASELRNPATARQSQLGKPGTVKNILPPFLQKYTIPEGLIPKGELGTATNPGPFAEIPVRMKPPTPELGTPENPGFYAKLPTRMPENAAAARANETPFEPLVYSSPQEPEQIAQRLANLKRQASSAGTYHAAQGSARKASTLQGRIAGKYLPFVPSE